MRTAIRPQPVPSLHQIQLSYVPEEDRLLLRVSTREHQELRFWLTRRLVARLWPLLVDQLAARADAGAHADPEARRSLLEFRHEAAVQQADFSAPYRDAPRETPLGAVPLLVTKARLRPGEAGFDLWLMPAEGSGVRLSLTEAMLHSLCRMLEQTAARTEWGLASPLGAPAPPPERLN